MPSGVRGETSSPGRKTSAVTGQLPPNDLEAAQIPHSPRVGKGSKGAPITCLRLLSLLQHPCLMIIHFRLLLPLRGNQNKCKPSSERRAYTQADSYACCPAPRLPSFAVRLGCRLAEHVAEDLRGSQGR